MKLTTTILALASAATTALHAADYYWWVSGNPTAGGSGEWNATATANFSDNGSTYNPTMYSSAATSNAIFTGSGGTITFAADMTMNNWEVNSPNYIFDLASISRAFTVNQFTGTHWGTAQFICTGVRTATFQIPTGNTTTFSGYLDVPNAVFGPRGNSILTLSSASNVTGIFRLGGTATTDDGTIIVTHRGVFGTAQLIISAGNGNTMNLTIAINDGDDTPFTISNGFATAGARSARFNGGALTFANCTGTNTSFTASGTYGVFFNGSDTKFTGAVGAPGEILLTPVSANHIIGGTGKVEFDVAFIQGGAGSTGLAFNNTSADGVTFTAQAANSTYTGAFSLGGSQYVPAIVRTATLNNNNTDGVFGNSTHSLYLGATTGSGGGPHAQARLIYDSSTNGSTNKSISIGPSGNGTTTTWLEAAGTGRFEITGNVGGYVSNSNTSTLNLALDGVGNGRIGPDTNAVGGNITNNSSEDVGFLQLLKQGTGTWVLDGDNTYTGKTTISAGTLILNGNNSDSKTTPGYGYGNANAGHYQVADGATLGGSGNISGNSAATTANLVLVQSGGFLAPGAAAGQVGTLTLDSRGLAGTAATTAIKALNMATGAKFSFDLAGNSADQISIWGFKGTTVNTSSVTFNSTVIDLNLLGGIATNVDVRYLDVPIFTFYSDNGVTWASNPLTTGLVIGSYDPTRIADPVLYYDPAGVIKLSYTVLAIPEPATWLLLGASLFVVTLFRKKKLS